MIDIALNDNHDLDLEGRIDLRLVEDAEQVKQQLLIKLKLWTGEWFLDTEFGTPYLQDILGKQLTLSGVIAAIRTSIMEVDGVQAITDFSFDFDRQKRILRVSFEAQTPYGIVEVSA